MHVTHSFTDESAIIRIEGLAAPVRMLQLTDTHIHFYDERDGEKAAVCAEFIKRREKHMKEVEGIDYVPGESFSKNLAQAASENLDLLALTGDIIHYPSPASVDFVVAEGEALGVPTVYNCGNHDVHYTDEPVNDA